VENPAATVVASHLKPVYLGTHGAQLTEDAGTVGVQYSLGTVTEVVLACTGCLGPVTVGVEVQRLRDVQHWRGEETSSEPRGELIQVGLLLESTKASRPASCAFQPALTAPAQAQLHWVYVGARGKGGCSLTAAVPSNKPAKPLAQHR